MCALQNYSFLNVCYSILILFNLSAKWWGSSTWCHKCTIAPMLNIFLADLWLLFTHCVCDCNALLIVAYGHIFLFEILFIIGRLLFICLFCINTSHRHYHHCQHFCHRHVLVLPDLTLPPGCARCYTCLALMLCQFGPMRFPKCNHKVTDL